MEYEIGIWLQFAFQGVYLGAIYALVAIGFGIVFNASTILNFAEGALVMFGGMVAFAFSSKCGLPLYAAVLLSIVAGGVVGFLTYRVVVYPLWRRRSPMYAIIMATFGVMLILENTALFTISSVGVGFPPFSSFGPFEIAGVRIGDQTIWIIITSLLLVAGLYLFFRYTIMGKAMRASAANRDAAALMGIPTGRMIMYSFVLCGLIGATAGVLITPAHGIAFNVSLPYALKGFCAAMVGGMGTIHGAILGGLLIGMMESFSVAFFPAGFKDVIVFAFLIVILIVMPSGFFKSLAEEEQ